MTPATGLFPHDPPRRHVSASGTHPIQQTVPMRPPQRGITVHPGLTRRWRPANIPCRSSAFILTAVWFRPNRPLPAPAEDEQFCPEAVVVPRLRRESNGGSGVLLGLPASERLVRLRLRWVHDLLVNAGVGGQLDDVAVRVAEIDRAAEAVVYRAAHLNRA